ncbi:hypothetical protein B9Z55_008053 [Caenorhabditis nigoni]|uniref:Uncharacterized protein n=2 Tax=Caenorhabditis nigoni TaxID=1611254 RepID=A0A2G5VCP3_9PELO|nr:hypothetical protein B9Z55_008053 [Caenorhabditis nigoni]
MSNLQVVENEKSNRMAKISKRQENLAADHRNHLESLENFEKSYKSSENVEKFNDSVEVLREFTNDLTQKFGNVSENLEAVIEGKIEMASCKTGVELLKFQIEKIEKHSEILKRNGEELEDFKGVEELEKLILMAKEWIDFFAKKVKDAENRQSIISQYETMAENVKFMKELGENPSEISDMEELANQFKLQVDMMKKPAIWTENHVENLKKSIENLEIEVDDINFIRSNLNEAIEKLANL